MRAGAEAEAEEREKEPGRELTEKGLATTRGTTVRRGAAGVAVDAVEVDVEAEVDVELAAGAVAGADFTAAGFFSTEVDAAAELVERTDFTGIVPLSFGCYYYLKNIHKNGHSKQIHLGN